MKTREIIKKQIDRFYNSSHNMSIDSLLMIQDKLSGNYYYLAEEYHLKQMEYVEAYTSYKSIYLNTFLQKKARKIEEKMTIKEMEQEAERMSEKEWANRISLEAEIEGDKILIKAIESVLRSIQQRISHLKKEKELSNNPMVKYDNNFYN